MIINYEQLIKAIHQKCISASTGDTSWSMAEHTVTHSIFQNELNDAFNSTLLDLGGHNSNLFSGYTLGDLANDKSRMAKLVLESIKQNVMTCLRSMVCDIHIAIKKGKSYELIRDEIMDAPIYFYKQAIMPTHAPSTYCHVCGSTTSYYMKDGVVSMGSVLVKDGPHWDKLDDVQQISIWGEGIQRKCNYPNGIEEHQSFMDVTSDHLVFANDLQNNLIPQGHSDSINYIIERTGYYNNTNSLIGSLYHQEFMLKHGLLMVPVQNSSPIIAFNKKTGSIMAVNSKAWRSKKDYIFPISHEGFKAKGKVITDAWCIQAVNSELVEKYAVERNLSFEEVVDDLGGVVVPVIPGRYKITNYNSNVYTDRPVICTIEKLG